MTQDRTLELVLDAHWISPYSFSAFVALTEKGVPFTLAPLALDKGEHKTEANRARLPTGRIPALRDGTLVLAESSAIVEYLEDRFPPPRHPRLLPAGIEDRARARMVMAFVRCDLLALREERPTTTMFYERAKAPLTDAGADAAARLLRFADSLIPDGQSQLFAEWSVADADLAFMLQRLVLNGHRTSAKIGNFVERQWARASVQKFVVRERPPAY